MRLIDQRPNKVAQRGKLQVKSSQRQDVTFHGKKVFQSIQAITHIHIFFSLRGVNFVVFGGNEERGDAEELKVGFGDFFVGKDQNVIDDLNADVNSFLVGFELFGHLENPLDQDLPHFEGDFSAVGTLGVEFGDDRDIEGVVEVLNVGLDFGQVGLDLGQRGWGLDWLGWEVFGKDGLENRLFL